MQMQGTVAVHLQLWLYCSILHPLWPLCLSWHCWGTQVAIICTQLMKAASWIRPSTPSPVTLGRNVSTDGDSLLTAPPETCQLVTLNLFSVPSLCLLWWDDWFSGQKMTLCLTDKTYFHEPCRLALIIFLPLNSLLTAARVGFFFDASKSAYRFQVIFCALFQSARINLLEFNWPDVFKNRTK